MEGGRVGEAERAPHVAGGQWPLPAGEGLVEHRERVAHAPLAGARQQRERVRLSADPLSAEDAARVRGRVGG